MGRNAIETVLGAVVLLVAGMFVYFAYTSAEVQAVKGYEVNAAFYKIGGLNKGGDVRVSGIKIGSVTSQGLDPDTYDAVVKMSISSDIKLPTDTVASIASEGTSLFSTNFASSTPSTSLDGKFIKLMSR